MKRFRFRLDRVEAWRRRVERERRFAHAAALDQAFLAETALRAQEQLLEAAVEAQARARRSGALSIEDWLADEALVREAAARRESRAAAHRNAQQAAAETLEQLIEARKEVETIAALRRTREARWRQEMESEAQKHSDEMHRIRQRRSAESSGEPYQEGDTP